MSYIQTDRKLNICYYRYIHHIAFYNNSTGQDVVYILVKGITERQKMNECINIPHLEKRQKNT